MRLKKTKDKQFWYHCTTKNHGKRVKFFPLDDGENRGGGEPLVPRTCVGPSISNCLVALPYFSGKKIHVYRTARRVFAYHPYDVSDSIVTREKWITKPVTLIRITVLNFSGKTVIGKISGCDSDCDGSDSQIALKYLLRRRLREAHLWGQISSKIPYWDI